MVRSRLDRILVEKGLAATRSRAQDLIARGCVRIGGVVITRPGQEISADAEIAVEAGADDYVSRGALKLIAALDHFGFDAHGRIALDIGASTGGFTQVLLGRGARKVYAVDVGRGQLHATVAGDARVVSLEATDSRALGPDVFSEQVNTVVADVSFISLTKALPTPLALTAAGAWLVALVKPQFEAGRAAIGKGGIVRDPADRQRAVEELRAWMTSQPGWTVAGVIESPIRGGSGNQEFLMGAVKND